MNNFLSFAFIKNESEIEALNGLRAISILGILFQHFWLIIEYNQIPAPYIVSSFFYNFVNFM
jgi:hypothetical protein